MTLSERLHSLCGGEIDGFVLFHPIFMHFAARYAGTTYNRFAQDHRVLVESNVRCLERFGHDAVSVISDPWREASAFGVGVRYPEDSVPVSTGPVVRNAGDIALLPVPDVHSSPRTRDRIDGVVYYRKLIGDGMPVIGWVEGPLAEACDLAGVNEILLNIALEPDFVRRLMDVCLGTAKVFAKAQIEAGSDVIGVGDAICSQISADMYREYVAPLHRELFAAIHECGALVKLHICGNITHLLPDIAQTGADIVDIDWMVDIARASEILGGKTVVCGNLDPVSVIQNGTAEQVGRLSRGCVGALRGKPFILSGGCEITAATQHANIDAMRAAAPKKD